MCVYECTEKPFDGWVDTLVKHEVHRYLNTSEWINAASIWHFRENGVLTHFHFIRFWIWWKKVERKWATSSKSISSNIPKNSKFAKIVYHWKYPLDQCFSNMCVSQKFSSVSQKNLIMNRDRTMPTNKKVLEAVSHAYL